MLPFYFNKQNVKYLTVATIPEWGRMYSIDTANTKPEKSIMWDKKAGKQETFTCSKSSLHYNIKVAEGNSHSAHYFWTGLHRTAL